MQLQVAVEKFNHNHDRLGRFSSSGYKAQVVNWTKPGTPAPTDDEIREIGMEEYSPGMVPRHVYENLERRKKSSNDEVRQDALDAELKIAVMQQSTRDLMKRYDSDPEFHKQVDALLDSKGNDLVQWLTFGLHGGSDLTLREHVENRLVDGVTCLRTPWESKGTLFKNWETGEWFANDGHGRLAKLDKKVVDRAVLNEAMAIFSRKTVRSWAMTACDANPTAWAHQAAIGRTVPGAQKFSPPKRSNSLRPKSDVDEFRLIEKHMGFMYDAFAQATYKRTQTQLRQLGYSEPLRLYRGTGVPSGRYYTHEQRAYQVRSPALAGQNTAGSWSSDRSIAGGSSFFRPSEVPGRMTVLLRASVPPRYVYSMPSSGPGCAHESEFVVVPRPRTIVTIEDRI